MVETSSHGGLPLAAARESTDDGDNDDDEEDDDIGVKGRDGGVRRARIR